MILKIISAILVFSLKISAARPPPDSCDAGSIQDCLASFETKFADCAGDDLHCQCTSVITSGANCYAACPQDAMTTFIKTYNEGRCATFDPYISRRGTGNSELDTLAEENAANHEEEERVFQSWLGIVATSPTRRSVQSEKDDFNLSINQGDAVEAIDASRANKTVSVNPKETGEVKRESVAEKAITVTADDPTTTISLSPQEYQSRLEKSRYKANLRSIRSERARLSAEAEARLAVPSKLSESSSATSLASTTFSLKAVYQKAGSTLEREHKRKHKSGASTAKVSPILVVAALFIAIC